MGKTEFKKSKDELIFLQLKDRIHSDCCGQFVIDY